MKLIVRKRRGIIIVDNNTNEKNNYTELLKFIKMKELIEIKNTPITFKKNSYLKKTTTNKQSIEYFYLLFHFYYKFDNIIKFIFN